MEGKTTSTIKFKAAILEHQNKPLVVDEVNIYLPGLGVGQVLVKVLCASICGKQIAEMNGAAGEDPYLPHLLGHEGGGVVEEIGAGVTTVQKGDRVVMHWRKGDGIDAKPPLRYQWGNKGVVGAGPIATFSELAIVSENRLTAIDDGNVSPAILALLGCAVTTGLGIINNEAKLKMGESIAVIGCGGVGLNVIQGAKMVSAYPIVAFDIHDKKLEMADKFGAHMTFNLNGNPISFGSVNVVVETTGITEMIEQAYMITAPGGRLILVGQPPAGASVTLAGMRKHYCGKTVMDSEGGQTQPHIDIPRYLNLYRAGILDLDALITHRFPLTRINEAVTMVKSGKCGKVILEIQ